MIRLMLLLLTALSLHAGHIRWYGDYDTAHAHAVKEQKPLMVFLVERGSEASEKMLATTLMNQPYIEQINRRFVPVLITKGTTQSYPIELLYTVTYPGLFFLTPEELFLSDALIGYTDAASLQAYLDDLTDSIEK